MKHDKKEDLLSIFTVSLALVACSLLIYMIRSPTVTGNVALDAFGKSTTIILIGLLILVGIAAIIGAITNIHALHKEKESHKKAIIEGRVVNHPELYEYISNAKQNGFKKHHIVNKLKENKWKEKEIKNHFNNN